MLVFLQPGHLMCSLPLSLPPARTWGPVVKNIFPTLTLKKIMEEGSRSGKRARTSFSMTLKVTALSLSLNLPYFQITQGTHCTLVSSGGPDFGDFITWKHLVRASQSKGKRQPPLLLCGERGRGWRGSKIHTCCQHACLSMYKVQSLQKLLT